MLWCTMLYLICLKIVNLVSRFIIHLSWKPWGIFCVVVFIVPANANMIWCTMLYLLCLKLHWKCYIGIKIHNASILKAMWASSEDIHATLSNLFIPFGLSYCFKGLKLMDIACYVETYLFPFLGVQLAHLIRNRCSTFINLYSKARVIKLDSKDLYNIRSHGSGIN